MKRYQCPCCGYFTYKAPPNRDTGYICRVCYWENDPYITSDDEPSGSNHEIALNEARANYLRFGACEKEMVKYVRPPKSNEMRRSGQPPLNSKTEQAIVRADCKNSVLWMPAMLWAVFAYIAFSPTIAVRGARIFVSILFLAFALWQSWYWGRMAFTGIEAYGDYLVVKRFGRIVRKLTYAAMDAAPQRKQGHRMIEYRVLSGGKIVVRFTSEFKNHAELYDMLCRSV